MLDLLRRASEFVLFDVGGAPIRLLDFLLVLAWGATILMVSRWIRRLIALRLLARTPLDAGTRHVLGALAGYAFMAIGLLSLLQSIGISLSAFNFLAGALGVGLGFGLQNIVSNFVSGLIVMFERPVRIGDHIEVTGIEGRVVEIGVRATTLATREGLTVIVPNQKLIVESVKNHDSPHGTGALRISVGIPANSDPAHVRRLLEGTASQHPDVARDPPPSARLLNLAAGSPAWELRAVLRDPAASREDVAADLRYRVLTSLHADGITTA